MHVHHVMQTPVRTCDLHATLEEAARTMWEHRVGSVVVVNHHGYVMGVLTDRDVAMGAYTTGRRLREVRVLESMGQPAVTCRPWQPLEEAELLMRRHQVRRLPVVDDADRLVGVLALDDLARHVRPAFDGEGALGGDAVARTLAATCEHLPAKTT